MNTTEHTAKTLFGGERITPRVELSPEERDRRDEERSRRCLAEAKIEDATRYFAHILSQNPCMSAMQTRWSEGRLAENSEAIARVRGWAGLEQAEDPLAHVLDRGVALPKKGLLLAGPTGRGKTRSVFALMETLSRFGIKYRFWFSGDWFAALSKQVRFGRDEAAEWVNQVAWLPLLILDDIGQEAQQARSEEWAMSWLFRLLDLRINRGLPLIASTNVSATEIAGGGSDRAQTRHDPFLRRLLELCEVLKFV